MKEMIKKKLRNVEIDHIMSFIEGTLRYFEDEEKEYQTNQYYVGIQNLFWGYMVKTWVRTNFSNNRCRTLNKIAAWLCVKHHNKCWNQRNEMLHDSKQYRDRIIKWYKNKREKAENSKHALVWMFAKKCKINEDRSSIDKIKKWIGIVKDMKKVEKLPKNNMWRYFKLG